MTKKPSPSFFTSFDIKQCLLGIFLALVMAIIFGAVYSFLQDTSEWLAGAIFEIPWVGALGVLILTSIFLCAYSQCIGEHLKILNALINIVIMLLTSYLGWYIEWWFCLSKKFNDVLKAANLIATPGAIINHVPLRKSAINIESIGILTAAYIIEFFSFMSPPLIIQLLPAPSKMELLSLLQSFRVII